MQLFIHRSISLFYSSVVNLYTFLVLISSVWIECVFAFLGPYCRMLFCLGIRKSLSSYNCGVLLLLSASSHFIELLKQLSKQRSALRYFASRGTGQACWTKDYFKALKSAQFGMQSSLSEYCCVSLPWQNWSNQKWCIRDDLCFCPIPLCSVANIAFAQEKSKLAEARVWITQEHRSTLQLHFNLSLLMLILEAGC